MDVAQNGARFERLFKVMASDRGVHVGTVVLDRCSEFVFTFFAD